ncbi:beta-parvin isoform X2 [Tribolium castaneum]|uniref:beta-parvin isoform X2 n=1 Tax=Tribolium castaneum TaxID=7070 RepID=UPI0030FEE812
MEEFIEKPPCQILYRQSSLETRLSPVHLSEESSESSDEEVENVNTTPKIVNVKIKTPVEKCNENEEEKLTAVYLMKSITPPKQQTPQEKCQSELEMATLRPKSPRPVGPKNDKEESIWDKLGTLGRKKRIKEVQEVQAEGKYAIDSPGHPTNPITPPEEYDLEDNEERCMVEPRSYDDPKFRELSQVLIDWINDELASQRIIVQDLAEDLYDGQVLQKLLEKLTNDKLDVPEVTQSEEGQKQKLSVVLAHFNQVLGVQRLGHKKWSVEAIHSKNIVPILHLLVALARHFRPPVRLPEHVSVTVVVVQKVGGQLSHRIVKESITTAYDDVGMRCERDAFDTLFDHAPDKLQVVKKSLVTFVNKHLNKINLEVSDLETQFHDGVYLIMLMGLLEGFFVPLYSFHPTPRDFEQKVHNVSFAFELMEEVGLKRPKARPEGTSVRFASKKTGGSTQNTHTKVRPKHRGWKVQDGHRVEAGSILATQRNLRFHPGLNVGFGRNGTLFAIVPGRVVVTCEKVDLNWTHTWVQRCHGLRQDKEFYKKYFNILPDKQHQNFKLIDQI